MELKNMLLPEKVVTFEFPGCEGLEFELAFLSKERNQKILKDSQKTKFDRKTRQPYEQLDDDIFLENYVAAIVRGWSGFKLEYLEEFVAIDTSDYTEDNLLDYTQENCLELMKNSAIFDNWVSGIIEDLENFTSNDSKKNSPESKTTSKKAAVA